MGSEDWGTNQSSSLVSQILNPSPTPRAGREHPPPCLPPKPLPCSASPSLCSLTLGWDWERLSAGLLRVLTLDPHSHPGRLVTTPDVCSEPAGPTFFPSKPRSSDQTLGWSLGICILLDTKAWEPLNYSIGLGGKWSQWPF